MDVEKLRELREFVEDYEADGCFCGVFRGCEDTGCRYGLHATVARALLARLEKLERVAEAVEPLADYARKRKASPLVGLGKSVHSIHAGTEHEAEITTDHLDGLLSALADLDGGKPS